MKRYNVDVEEMRDEGGALDDAEKQHKRSVLEVKKHERIVLELWLEELQDAVFNTEDLVVKIHTEALRHKLVGQISKEMEDIRCSLESYAELGYSLGLVDICKICFWRPKPYSRYTTISYWQRNCTDVSWLAFISENTWVSLAL